MTPQERKSLIIKYKENDRIVEGRYIDLHPYKPEHAQAVVFLRNQEKSRYYLNQKQLLAVDDQNNWYDSYAKRDDDLYWCIYNKSETLIGTVRLYDIDPGGNFCEEGSFIIDETYAMGGPYALEAKILVFDFALDTLQMHKVINKNRSNNKNMNSISRKMGFQFIEEFDLNGAKYNLYELVKGNYTRANLQKILDRWKERG